MIDEIKKEKKKEVQGGEKKKIWCETLSSGGKISSQRIIQSRLKNKKKVTGTYFSVYPSLQRMSVDKWRTVGQGAGLRQKKSPEPL